MALHIGSVETRLIASLQQRRLPILSLVQSSTSANQVPSHVPNQHYY
ncbi:MAG: hypothetical protein KME64_06440 [Scytonematopsis contorta HA4267-MV1]|nr:hypothetical protein [Scytonematopsis contorta HA4267-MV1]